MRITMIVAMASLLLLAGCGGGGTKTVPPPASFRWAVLEATDFTGDSEPREAVFRSASDVQAALPGRDIPVDWTKTMVAYISLGEMPSTNHKVRVLDVRRESDHIVVVYQVERIMIGLPVFCTPGAIVEMTASSLPVYFQRTDGIILL